MARTKFSELRAEVVNRPGVTERLAALRVETLEEIRLTNFVMARQSVRQS